MDDKKPSSYDWPEYLTVGKLKERLLDLPDDMPVFYQHIDDAYMWKGGGWKENAVRTRDPLYTTENGEGWTDDWHHRAFSAYKDRTIDGKEIFIITAHY